MVVVGASDQEGSVGRALRGNVSSFDGEVVPVNRDRGARGRPPADLEAVVETIHRLSQLVSAFPAIEELDVNPLLVRPGGVRAVDLRVAVDRTALSD